MVNEGYDEPVEELSEATKDMHRAIVSLTAELRSVDWYGQKIDACKDEDLKAIFTQIRNDEKEHAAVLLEWLRRRDPTFNKEMMLRRHLKNH